jgi:hypothetical protein
MPHSLHNTRTYRGIARFARHSALLTMVAALFWIGANIVELATGQRVLPWNPYALCGASAPDALPATVRVGLYEEFPNPWRLAKLEQLDFPTTLAIGTGSRDQFVQLRDEILRQYPMVHDVYFWPLLAVDEGYYPGTWSDHQAVRRVAAEAEAMPVLWDLEMPLKTERMSLVSWPQNYAFLDQWLRQRSEPVHLWRSHDTMGLDPLFLRLIGMHYDPQEYAAVRMHLDLYANGQTLSDEQMARVLRCGVERYGEQFIPSFGVLDDGEGVPSYFVSPEILLRDLRLARQAGVSEVWLFGVNGLNEAYVSAIREALPIEQQIVASGN